MKSINNIVFYGNRNTGLVVLSYLVAQRYSVKVITEDKNIKVLCRYYDLPVVRLDSMGEFDLFICCHGREIINEQHLEIGKFINIHPCLYKYKGHDPIERYIKNEDTKGSVESQYLIEEVDGGDVIHSEFFDTPIVKTYAEFYNIAMPYYFNCIHKTLEHLKYETDVKGWMSEEELGFLAKSAKDLDVVELGSYLGRTTAVLAQVAHTVSAVDHWKGSEGLKMDGTEYERFRENIDKYKNIAIYQMSTLDASKAITWKPDMVFIDADHTYKAVKGDIKAWLPKTKVLMCGHDYDFDEVKRAVDELIDIDGTVGSVWYKWL